MESKWLEDFVSLAETRSFSRSAELRHVTQPAFSRRIRSLEAWLGADLVDRTSYPTRLTPAGEVFYEQALSVLSQLTDARTMMLYKRPSALSTIDVAAPHTLSLTYIPRWLTSLEQHFGRFSTRLIALNVHDAALTLVDGGCDLLLCYHHSRQPVQIDAMRYDMLVLGSEMLCAYVKAELGVPRWTFPGSELEPVPFLSYTPNAYLGRMVEQIMQDAGAPLYLDKRYETDMAEGLKMMVLEGHGVAFLPQSAVVRELAVGLLMPVPDSQRWQLTMDIRLYRERPGMQRHGKQIVLRLWEYLNKPTG